MRSSTPRDTNWYASNASIPPHFNSAAVGCNLRRTPVSSLQRESLLGGRMWLTKFGGGNLGPTRTRKAKCGWDSGKTQLAFRQPSPIPMSFSSYSKLPINITPPFRLVKLIFLFHATNEASCRCSYSPSGLIAILQCYRAPY